MDDNPITINKIFKLASSKFNYSQFQLLDLNF